jgi:hypothetical protein
MAVNNKQFAKSIEQDLKKLINQIEQVEKDVVNEIFDALLEPKQAGGTPKKTGHLRSNFIITTDSKFNGVVGSPENVDISKREQSRTDFDNEQNLITKKSITINNNVPYGPKVNSSQRFREASIQRGLERLNKQRKL